MQSDSIGSFLHLTVYGNISGSKMIAPHREWRKGTSGMHLELRLKETPGRALAPQVKFQGRVGSHWKDENTVDKLKGWRSTPELSFQCRQKLPQDIPHGSISWAADREAGKNTVHTSLGNSVQPSRIRLDEEGAACGKVGYPNQVRWAFLPLKPLPNPIHHLVR